MFRPLLRFIAVLFVIAPVLSWAADIKPDHPKTYTVKQGDTLWGVAGRFLQNPWQWPEIWKANPDIKDPDLIYPGDVLELVYVDGKPQLRRKSSRRAGAKLSPRIRSDRGAIPPVPVEAISPFLTHPRVIDRAVVDAAPHIIGFPDGNLVGGEGMRAYAHGMNGEGAAHFDILRKGRTYTDSGTGDELGYMARFIGQATLVRGGDPATVRLDSTEIEVMRGDRLIAYTPVSEPGYFFPKPPRLPMEGEVLDAYESISQVGRYHVVLIDLGADDAVSVGDVLLVDNRGDTVRDIYGPKEEQRVYDEVVTPEVGGIFRQSLIPPEIQLPDERAGSLMIFDVFDRMSLALVMDSARPIRKGDWVRSP
jgi:hypothetical protein